MPVPGLSDGDCLLQNTIRPAVIFFRQALFFLCRDTKAKMKNSEITVSGKKSVELMGMRNHLIRKKSARQ
jgi:hypothetical protein